MLAFAMSVLIFSATGGTEYSITPCTYTGHFGRLKNLETGGSVIFTDADGNVFNYKVSKIETLVPSAVEEMTSGDWDFTVFTCTVGGRTRVAVRCTLEKS